MNFHKKMIEYTSVSEFPFKFSLNSGEGILKIKKAVIMKVRKNRSRDNNQVTCSKQMDQC